LLTAHDSSSTMLQGKMISMLTRNFTVGS
jgi:hypothetical protein